MDNGRLDHESAAMGDVLYAICHRPSYSRLSQERDSATSRSTFTLHIVIWRIFSSCSIQVFDAFNSAAVYVTAASWREHMDISAAKLLLIMNPFTLLRASAFVPKPSHFVVLRVLDA